MRNLLYILILAPIIAFAQVPQGVGYQGVATDAAGFELINQSISIRASVISGSATGTIEWQEIHNTSTDTFGLFNLTIGQGTSTGNGVQTSFADITWGANTHFLKIEMDVNGGTNYSHMGTNQMMSVPYALYAENANIDYDSIATIISNDSSFINSFSFGGNMVFGDTVDYNLTFNDNGFGLFETDFIRVSSDGFLRGNWYGNFGNGIEVEYGYDTLNLYFSSYGDGFGSFTIPLKNNYYFKFTKHWNTSISTPYFLKIDSNSSSTSTVDSSYIDSLVQFYSSGNGGCDPLFPDGFEMLTAVSSTYSTSSPYTVPLNKRLYIAFSNTNILINGIEIGTPSGKHILCNPGDVLTSANGSTYQFSGFLVNCNPSITAVSSTYSTSSPYTVPLNKRLYIAFSNTNILINGIEIGTPSGKHILCNPGDVLTSANGSTYQFSGYLADENYFADCGGGGSTNSTVDSSYIDSLVQFYSSVNGGGCDYMYPEGLNGDIISQAFNDNNPYTVPAGKRFYILSYSHNTSIYVDGFQAFDIGDGTPYIANEGQVISTNHSAFRSLNGFLVDLTPLQVISQAFNDNNPYTVPTGKRFYILSYSHNTSIYVDGFQAFDIGDGTPYIANEGQVISTNHSAFRSLNGYLADENYFADCGSGGSSSSGSSSSGPIFISPIEIHGNGGSNKDVCENSNQTSFMTGIQFNVDSALNQQVSNIILNIDFVITPNGLSYSCSNSAMEMESWNGTVATPILDYYYQSTLGTNSSRTLISKQVIMPLNNGYIDINVSGYGCCQVSEGQIQIVGYY